MDGVDFNDSNNLELDIFDIRSKYYLIPSICKPSIPFGQNTFHPENKEAFQFNILVIDLICLMIGLWSVICKQDICRFLQKQALQLHVCLIEMKVELKKCIPCE